MVEEAKKAAGIDINKPLASLVSLQPLSMVSLITLLIILILLPFINDW